MNIKSMRFWLPVVLIVTGIYGIKSWQALHTRPTPVPARVHGPAIILFRGLAGAISYAWFATGAATGSAGQSYHGL